MLTGCTTSLHPSLSGAASREPPPDTPLPPITVGSCLRTPPFHPSLLGAASGHPPSTHHCRELSLDTPPSTHHCRELLLRTPPSTHHCLELPPDTPLPPITVGNCLRTLPVHPSLSGAASRCCRLRAWSTGTNCTYVFVGLMACLFSSIVGEKFRLLVLLTRDARRARTALIAPVGDKGSSPHSDPCQLTRTLLIGRSTRALQKRSPSLVWADVARARSTPRADAARTPPPAPHPIGKFPQKLAHPPTTRRSPADQPLTRRPPADHPLTTR